MTDRASKWIVLWQRKLTFNAWIDFSVWRTVAESNNMLDLRSALQFGYAVVASVALQTTLGCVGGGAGDPAPTGDGTTPDPSDASTSSLTLDSKGHPTETGTSLIGTTLATSESTTTPSTPTTSESTALSTNGEVTGAESETTCCIIQTTSDTSTTEATSDLYGPCAGPDLPCPDGQDCLNVQGIDGSFCSPKCDGMSCPAFDGGAMELCVLVHAPRMNPTNCALICDPDGGGNQCPVGETCKQIPMQEGVGLCTAP